MIFPELGKLITGVIGYHCSSALRPARWANFTMFIGVLEALNETKGFLDIAPDRKVANAYVTEDALVVNNVSSAERDSSFYSVFDQGSVAATYALGHVRKHGYLHRT